MPVNLRRMERIESPQRVSISWDDKHGQAKFASARALNISENGISLRLNEPLEVRSLVTLRSEGLKLAGSATVRYCIRRNGWHYVGLEFSGGMTYKFSAV
jgi:hypothetical protein